MSEQKNESPKQKNNADARLFDLDKSFETFLILRGIDPAKMVEEKGGFESLKELRHAYFGGLSQMYVVLAMEVPQVPPAQQQKAVEYIANLLNKYAADHPELMEEVERAKKKNPHLFQTPEEKKAAYEEAKRQAAVQKQASEKTFPGPTPVK